MKIALTPAHDVAFGNTARYGVAEGFGAFCRACRSGRTPHDPNSHPMFGVLPVIGPPSVHRFVGSGGMTVAPCVPFICPAGVGIITALSGQPRLSSWQLLYGTLTAVVHALR